MCVGRCGGGRGVHVGCRSGTGGGHRNHAAGRTWVSKRVRVNGSVKMRCEEGVRSV